MQLGAYKLELLYPPNELTLIKLSLFTSNVSWLKAINIIVVTPVSSWLVFAQYIVFHLFTLNLCL